MSSFITKVDLGNYDPKQSLNLGYKLVLQLLDCTSFECNRTTKMFFFCHGHQIMMLVATQRDDSDMDIIHMGLWGDFNKTCQKGVSVKGTNESSPLTVSCYSFPKSRNRPCHFDI